MAAPASPLLSSCWTTELLLTLLELAFLSACPRQTLPLRLGIGPRSVKRGD